MSVEKRILGKQKNRSFSPTPLADILDYTDSFSEACLILSFGAEVIHANQNARSLIHNHPAFFTSSNGFSLSHQKRARSFIRRVNATIFERRPQYLRLDNGCDEAKLTGIFTPITSTDKSGAHTKPELVLLRIVAENFHLPLLNPLRKSHGLTPRQVDILKPFCDGFSVQNAGEEIGITTQRARELFCGIYQRLGLRGKSELIAFLSKLPSDPDI